MMAVGVADPTAAAAPVARPRAAPWLTLGTFVTGLERPGALLGLPNGDLLITERESGGRGRILIVRDADRDGRAEQRVVLIRELDRPDGLLLRRDRLYVAHAGGIDACPFLVGQLRTIPTCRSLDLTGPAAAGAAHGLAMSPDELRLFSVVGGRVVSFAPSGADGRYVDPPEVLGATGLAVEPRRARAWRVAQGVAAAADAPAQDFLLTPADAPPPAGATPAEGQVTLQFYRRRALPAGLHGAALLALPTRAGAPVGDSGRVVAVPFVDGSPSGPARVLLSAADGAALEPGGLAVLADGSIVVADAAAGAVWRLAYMP
jgi:glucose/arabinose dehydrogenase